VASTTVVRAPREARGVQLTAANALALGLLALAGLGTGVSAIADGYYDVTVWGPISVGVLAVALGVTVVTPARPRLLPALAAGSLGGIWLWSLLSSAWAESKDDALLTASRWALYAGLFLALLLLMRDRRQRWLPLALATAGILFVAGYVVVRMLHGDADALFFSGRLRDPLGYVNGQAGYFLLGFWPCVALAEQTRSRVLAGLGAAFSLVLASLLLLSQTRGVLPGLVVSAVVVLALIPGRPRRVWALVAVAIGLIAIASPLLDVYRDLPPNSQADPELVKQAARRIVFAAAVVGVLWAVVQEVLQRVAAVGPRVRTSAFRLEAVLAAIALVVAVGGAAVASGDPVQRVRDQYDDFVNLRTTSSSDTRFLSGGGYRYDYWRVAWKEFKSEPLRGLGAGNYTRDYFLERRTSEDIRQPHSLPLQTLAELGVVGGALLAVFVAAVLAGLWRQSRRARNSPSRRLVAVAAGGAFVAWFTHTSVDWLHNIPGVTGIALCAAAALVAPWARRTGGVGFTTARIFAVAAVGLAVIVAADVAGRLAYADHLRIQGRHELRSNPIDALHDANRALALNGDSLPALYIKSAAYARLDRYRRARATLIEARRLEPHDPLPWALLGDIAARRRDFRAARSYYRRSSELDPKNALIKSLARDPRAALSGPR
jgi:O-antigen ligase